MDDMDEATETPQKDVPHIVIKPRILQCVAKSGQIIIRQIPHGHEVPQQITLPLHLAQDTRLFLKNGALVTPFITIDFKHRKTLDVSGIDIHIFNEVATHEFDSTNLEPVGIRSLEDEFKELNPSLLA
jgi:hypothetical protein